MTEKMSDPLALAKWQLKQYARVGTPKPPPPGSKIVLEEAKSTSRGKKVAPARSGEPWTDEERMRLVRAYLKDEHIGTIAMNHQRSPGACESQLRAIGFIIE